MTRRNEPGFTLIEMMIVMLLIGIVSAAAVPTMQDLSRSMKLGQGAREVERELQDARLKAVTTNRPIRIRFNCPSVKQYRIVELIGSPQFPVLDDGAGDRCSTAKYPYPAADNSPTTRPNHDGPLRTLNPILEFGAAATLEFWPDGSVHKQVAGEQPWAVVPPEGTAITVKMGAAVKTITVNGLGKIQLQ